ADDREMEVALAGVAGLALIERCETDALEEALDRVGRRADARTAALLGGVRLALGQAFGDQGQPPRRRIGVDAGGDEPNGFELFGGEPREIVGRPALHARRDLLGEERERQLRHGARAAPAAAPASLRSRIWRARARGRYRRRARSPR